MINPFRLKGPFGSEYGIDADDILRTKKALSSLGHLPGPKGPITPYADRWMIDGLKSFQRSNGLAVDGVMKPGGPTAKALGRALGDIDEPRRFVADPRRESLPPYVISELPQERPHWPRPFDLPRPSPSVFGTLFEVGRGRRNLPRDVLAARRALAWSGDLSPNRAAIPTNAGADDHADLFDAIERFQKRNDLKTDGWMGPNGETAKALDAAVAEKVKAHEEATARNDQNHKGSGVRVASSYPISKGISERLRKIFPLDTCPVDERGHAMPTSPTQLLESLGRHDPSLPGETTPPARAQGNNSISIGKPFPSSPPPLTPLDDNRFPNKEEYPAETPVGPATEIFPNPEERKAVLESFPDQSDELLQQIIMENSRGDESTQLDTDYLIKTFDKNIKRWKRHGRHTGGGHSPDGTYQAERFIRPIGGLGAARPDGSFTFPDADGKPHIEDLQTVDVLKDGETPTARERRAEEKIKALKEKHGEHGGVYSFPKSRGKKREHWESEIDALVDFHFWRKYGRPPKAR